MFNWGITQDSENNKNCNSSLCVNVCVGWDILKAFHIWDPVLIWFLRLMGLWQEERNTA